MNEYSDFCKKQTEYIKKSQECCRRRWKKRWQECNQQSCVLHCTRRTQRQATLIRWSIYFSGKIKYS